MEAQNAAHACDCGKVKVTLLDKRNGAEALTVTFGGNIAISTGGTVAPISVAIAINGEPLPATTMTVTPAAVGDFFNVSRTTFIDVPCGCCVTIAVENTSTTAAGVAIPIDVANANILIERVA